MTFIDSNMVATWFNAGCAAIATGAAVFVAIRDSRWRKSGLAKQLTDKIDQAQLSADRWHESFHGRELFSRMSKADRAIAEHDGQLKNVATKVELAEVTTKLVEVRGMVQNVENTAKDVAGGVDRIETMLMTRALEMK